MTDHLTAAILAAARLDDTEAAKHLGHVVDLNEPHAVARVTEGRPSLRASMERSGYLASDHDDESAVEVPSIGIDMGDSFDLYSEAPLF